MAVHCYVPAHVCVCAQMLAVSCITWDERGNIWTGHLDGSVRLHNQGKWDAARSVACAHPVRSIAVDAKRQCWVGDDGGFLKVLRHDPITRNLNLVWQNMQAPAPYAPGAWGAVAPGYGGYSVPPLPAAPIHAMLSQGLYVFTAGGKTTAMITLWLSHQFQTLEFHDCQSYGPCGAFAIVAWDGPATAAGPDCGCRLLSGHDSGQVLMWQLVSSKMRLVAVVGEPGHSCVR